MHDFLRECSPIIGTQVPEIDILETGELNDDFSPISSRRELAIESPTFAADSVEAMAGITADDLAAPASEAITELLGGNDPQHQIDMSEMGKVSTDKKPQSDVEIPDDLFDFD